MLARENRLVSADDFRSTMRGGRKFVSANLVTYSKRVEEYPQARFGFVVAKTIGNAVTRNLTKRRMREISRALLSELQSSNYVVRALPGIEKLSFQELKLELETALKKSASN